MKQAILFTVVILLFASCKKAFKEEIRFSNEPTAGNIDANIQPAPAYRWAQLFLYPSLENLNRNIDEDNIVFSVAGDIYCVTDEHGYLQNWYKFNNTTKQWQYQPGITHMFLSSAAPNPQFTFTYQNKVYSGLPYEYNGAYTSAFRSFNPATNTTVQLAPFPGDACGNFTAFVIGDKGYLLGGSNSAKGIINQLWEYNFSTNHWVNKGGSPVRARAGATAIVLNGKAYIGLGFTRGTLNNQPALVYKNDWVLYNPSSPYFGILTNFAGAKRSYARGFVIDGNIYLGFGINGSTGYNDFWKYNTVSNSWTQQAGYPGNSTVNDWNTNVFAIGNTGYVVKGNLAAFYKFTSAPF